LEQLAEKAGVSKSFLWEVEQGRSNMSGEKLVRVANALVASLDYLLLGKAAPKDPVPATIEIPRELGELAEEEGLTYRQTMSLMDIERSIVARRSGRPSESKTKDDWRKLFEGVREFIEELP
jgi:transcriptional regulator with XRE-family HTH domain